MRAYTGPWVRNDNYGMIVSLRVSDKASLKKLDFPLKSFVNNHPGICSSFKNQEKKFIMLQGDTKRPLGFDSIKIVYLDKKVTEKKYLNLTAVTILIHQDLLTLA